MISRFHFKSFLYSLGIDSRSGVDGFLFKHEGLLLARIKTDIYIDASGKIKIYSWRQVQPAEDPGVEALTIFLSNSKRLFVNFPELRSGFERYINTISEEKIDLSTKFEKRADGGQFMVNEYGKAMHALLSILDKEG